MKTFRTIAIAFGIAIVAQICGVSFAAPFPTGVGGTGTSITPASGTLPIGNGAGSYTPAQLTPGTNMTIVNGSGTITLNAAGGAVTISPVTGASTTFSIIGDGTFVKVTNPSGNTIEVQPATTSIGIWANNGLYLIAANNLSDVTNTSTARANLGLGSAALQNAGFFLVAGNNLSDLTSTSSARSNIGYSGVANQITISGTGAIGFATTSISQFVNDRGFLTSAIQTLQGLATSSITIVTSTQSQLFNVTVQNGNQIKLTIPPASDYLASSTVFVSSVNGSSGAVTISSSSLGVIWPSVNGNTSAGYFIVPGAGLTSTISGATTTLILNLSSGCAGNQFVSTISPTGTISCATPSGGASSTNIYGTNGVSVIQVGVNATASLDTTYAASWSALEKFLQGLNASGTVNVTGTVNVIANSTSAAALFINQLATTAALGSSTLILEGQASGTDAFVMRQNRGAGGYTDFRIIGVGTAFPILTLVAPNGTDYADLTYDGNNTELDVSTGSLQLRPLGTTGNVNVWSTTHNEKLRIGSQNFTQSLDISHDGSNGHISVTTGTINFDSTVTIPALTSQLLRADGNHNITFAGVGGCITFDGTTISSTCTGTVTTSSAGVANTLPLWTSGSALGNSQLGQAAGGITDNGSQIIDGGGNWTGNVVQTNSANVVQAASLVWGGVAGNVSIFNTTTTVSTSTFCGANYAVAQNTTSGITITFPNLSGILQAPCAGTFPAQSFTMFENISTNTVQFVAGASETIKYAIGTSPIMQPGQIWTQDGGYSTSTDGQNHFTFRFSNFQTSTPFTVSGNTITANSVLNSNVGILNTGNVTTTNATISSTLQITNVNPSGTVAYPISVDGNAFLNIGPVTGNSPASGATTTQEYNIIEQNCPINASTSGQGECTFSQSLTASDTSRVFTDWTTENYPGFQGTGIFETATGDSSTAQSFLYPIDFEMSNYPGAHGVISHHLIGQAAPVNATGTWQGATWTFTGPTTINGNTQVVGNLTDNNGNKYSTSTSGGSGSSTVLHSGAGWNVTALSGGNQTGTVDQTYPFVWTSTSTFNSAVNVLGSSSLMLNSVPAIASKNIIDAAQYGCAENSNIQTGGGTDDTVCLQNAINKLSSLGGGTLLMDGVSLISNVNETLSTSTGYGQSTALVIPSNVYIVGANENTSGFYMASSTNEIMIGNNINYASTTTSNFGLMNLSLNGNSSHQTLYNGNAYEKNATSTGWWVFGMWFGGYTNLLINNVNMIDPSNFGLVVSNATGTVINNFTQTIDGNAGGQNNDGIHFWSNLNNIVVNNFQDHAGTDDALAFNTCEDAGLYAGPRRGTSTLSFATTTDVVVNGVFLDNTKSDVRLYGDNTFGGCGTGGAGTGKGYLNNIFLNDIYGNNTTYAMPGGGTNIGNITINGWYVTGANTINIAGTFTDLSNIAAGTPVVNSGSIFAGDYYSPVMIDGVITANTTDALTQNVGGGLNMGGVYDNLGDGTTFASVKGVDETGLNNDTSGALQFRTEAHGSFSTREVGRFGSDGNFMVGTTTETGNVSVSGTIYSSAIAPNSFVATNASGVLVATGTPAGGGSGSISTTTPVTTNYYPFWGSSNGLTGTSSVLAVGGTTSTAIIGNLSVGTTTTSTAQLYIWGSKNQTSTFMIGATSTATSSYRTGCIEMTPSVATGSTIIYWDFTSGGNIQTSTTGCP
jgi:hypothetical protein